MYLCHYLLKDDLLDAIIRRPELFSPSHLLLAVKQVEQQQKKRGRKLGESTQEQVRQ